MVREVDLLTRYNKFARQFNEFATGGGEQATVAILTPNTLGP